MNISFIKKSHWLVSVFFAGLLLVSTTVVAVPVNINKADAELIDHL